MGITGSKQSVRAGGVGGVLMTLAAGQFLMTLDSSVMNVAIATVAADVGTTVTGIQLAITLYLLVMAMFMVTGGKIGSMIGRLRAFSIGCVVYGLGSLITALAPNLLILVLGWSVLEGLGAALILPAIVALVAGNVPAPGRPRAYGIVMGAGAIAVAVGPLIGGFATTYFSWRWVFVGEVLIVAVILLLARRMRDAAPAARVRFDFVGAVLIALGLGLAVVGILQSSEWGWVQTKPGGPSILGLSPTVWLVLVGLLVVWIFLERASRLEARGGEPLVRPSLLANRQVSGGLLMFLLLYLVQAGLFFTIPLFLSVALGLSALETGIRILPLSITLLAAAVGVPRMYPQASPRRVVRLGLLALLLGVLFLMVALEPTADAQIVTLPLLLAGLGIGALASQLGAVTVSAVPDEVSPEVGGLQNTATNLGAAIGTALAGSILISISDRRIPARCRGEQRGASAGQRAGRGTARERRALHVRRGPASRVGTGGRSARRQRGRPRRQRDGTGSGAARRPGRAPSHLGGRAGGRPPDPRRTGGWRRPARGRRRRAARADLVKRRGVRA